MAKYLDYEGLKTYDGLIKNSIGVKAIVDISKITADTFPVNTFFQYLGEDDEENDLVNGNYYKINGYDEDGKPEIGPFASEGGATTEEIESNVDCGAIKSGTTIDEGTDLTAFIKKLLVQEKAPTVTLTLTEPAGTYQVCDETATDKDGKLLAPKFKQGVISISKGTASSIDKVSFVDPVDGNTDAVELQLVGGKYVFELDEARIVTENTTFTAKVEYTESDGVSKKTSTTTAKYEFINPIIVAIGKDTTITDLADLPDTVLGKPRLASPSTVEIKLAANDCVASEVVLFVPGDKTVSSVKDKSGFDYTNAWKDSKEIVEITDRSGEKATYTKVYSGTATLLDGFTYTVKF